MGLTKAHNRMLEGVVPVTSVKEYGAVGDGVVNDQPAIAAAFAASKNIYFPPGTYRMEGSVSKSGTDNLTVDFGEAILLDARTSTGSLFYFGTSSDTPLNTNLDVRGGTFNQSDPATTVNHGAIRVRGYTRFLIENLKVNNIGGGAIIVEAGCSNGIIRNVVMLGRTAYTPARGIWLAGDTASDYDASTNAYQDISTVQRTATAFPVYRVDNVTVSDCTIEVDYYGIYLHNAHNCNFINNKIDISGVGAKRCLALNVYSTNTLVSGNTFTSDRSSTGILVTTYSTDTLIKNNLFNGDFGGNRDIYVRSGARATVDNNVFNTLTTQAIAVTMDGHAVIKNNTFNKSAYLVGERCVHATPLDPSEVNPAMGATCTTLIGSVIFTDNIINTRMIGINYDALTYPGGAASGSLPAMKTLVCKNNIFPDMTGAGANEYPVFLTTEASSTYQVSASYFGNEIFPASMVYKNTLYDGAGDGYTPLIDEDKDATFLVTSAASAGALTVDKITGSNMTLTIARSTTDFVLTPRTTGGGVPAIFGIVDESNTAAGVTVIARFQIQKTPLNKYTVECFNAAGTQLDASTVALKFKLKLGGTPIA